MQPNKDMLEALLQFLTLYQRTGSIEIGILELKRKGFSQNDTVKVLMKLCKLSAVDADKCVMNSLAWAD